MQMPDRTYTTDLSKWKMTIDQPVNYCPATAMLLNGDILKHETSHVRITLGFAIQFNDLIQKMNVENGKLQQIKDPEVRHSMAQGRLAWAQRQVDTLVKGWLEREDSLHVRGGILPRNDSVK